MNVIDYIHIKTPRFPKQRFVAGGAAAVAMAGGLLLGIRLRFHDDAPQKLAIGLALHQQAANQLGGDQLGGAGEEGWGGELGRSWWLWEWLIVEIKSSLSRFSKVIWKTYLTP